MLFDLAHSARGAFIQCGADRSGRTIETRFAALSTVYRMVQNKGPNPGPRNSSKLFKLSGQAVPKQPSLLVEKQSAEFIQESMAQVSSAVLFQG
jgi:hypothetical protein